MQLELLFFVIKMLTSCALSVSPARYNTGFLRTLAALLIADNDVCVCVPTVSAASQMVLLLQTDISARAELEMRMAALTETQLTMLEQVGGLGVRGYEYSLLHGGAYRDAAYHA
jgi:hypothetical protein